MLSLFHNNNFACFFYPFLLSCVWYLPACDDMIQATAREESFETQIKTLSSRLKEVCTHPFTHCQKGNLIQSTINWLIFHQFICDCCLPSFPSNIFTHYFCVAGGYSFKGLFTCSNTAFDDVSKCVRPLVLLYYWMPWQIAFF